MYSSGWDSSPFFPLYPPFYLLLLLFPSSSHRTKMLPGPALVVMATRKGGSVTWPDFLGFWLARSSEVKKERWGRGRCQTPTSSQIGGILGEAACKHTDTKDVILRWSYPEVQQWRTNLESCWYLARRDGNASSGLSLSSHLQTARAQHAEITRNMRVVKNCWSSTHPPPTWAAGSYLKEPNRSITATIHKQRQEEPRWKHGQNNSTFGNWSILHKEKQLILVFKWAKTMFWIKG